MGKKVPVNIYPGTSACWDMEYVHVISASVDLCCSHAFKHNFQIFVAWRRVLCWKFLVLLESPNRHSLLVAVIPMRYWTALNTPESLYVTPQPKIQWIKSRGWCRPVDWAFVRYPLFTKSLVPVLSDSAEKIRCWPIMHELHVLSLMKRHIFQIIYQIKIVSCTC